ncbi:MAG TPA: AAA family ATPase [Chloroflexota bacterium]|nr:AAA family ATPase [Chloroflexota bacterium]HZU04871.1 AAA family ATPase [Chloroflexota bacterium]
MVGDEARVTPIFDPGDLWRLERYRLGGALDDLDALKSDICRQVAEAMQNANGRGRDGALDDVLATLDPADAAAIRDGMAMTDPYGEDPGGEASTPRPRFTLESLDDLAKRPPLEWQIEGYSVVGTLGVAYGPSGVGKTLLEMAENCCLASSKDFCGRKTRGGYVVHVLAEGASGALQRVQTWLKHHPGADLSRLRFICEAVNLMEDAEVGALLAQIATLPEPPVKITIDTMARCMVGGDENSSRDVGRVVAACDRIIAATGAHVRLVHHTGKGGEVERGSSALRGAAQTMLFLTANDGVLTLHCDKQRDGDEFEDITLTIVADSTTESCFLAPAEPPERSHELTPSARHVLAALAEHFPEDEGAATTWWLKVSGVSEPTFYRARKQLLREQYVRQEGKRHVLAELGRVTLGLPLVTITGPVIVTPAGDSSHLTESSAGMPELSARDLAPVQQTLTTLTELSSTSHESSPAPENYYLSLSPPYRGESDESNWEGESPDNGGAHLPGRGGDDA